MRILCWTLLVGFFSLVLSETVVAQSGDFSDECELLSEVHPRQRRDIPRVPRGQLPDRRWRGQDSATALDFGIQDWRPGMRIGGPTCVTTDEEVSTFLWAGESTPTHTRIYYRVWPNEVEYKLGRYNVLAMRLNDGPATPDGPNTFYTDLTVGTRLESGLPCEILYERVADGHRFWDSCRGGRIEILRKLHRQNQENGIWNFFGLSGIVDVGEHQKYPSRVQEAMAHRQVDLDAVYDILAFRICLLVTPEGLVPLPDDPHCGIRVCQMTYSGPYSVVYFFVTLAELRRMGYVDNLGRARCPDDPPTEEDLAVGTNETASNSDDTDHYPIVPPYPEGIAFRDTVILIEEIAS